MKHKLILNVIFDCLNQVSGLRTERDRRQPDDEEDLRDFGPIAILYSGERETAPLNGQAPEIWSRRWELKPVVTVLIHDSESDDKRDELERIESEFIDALDNHPDLQPNMLLAAGTGLEFKTQIRHPDEADLGGMEMFLNLTYDR